MATTLKPRDADEVGAAIAWAASEGQPLELLGAGTKRGLGRPVQASHGLDLSGLNGVTLYEPEELVLSARAGTPLAEIEALVAVNRQQLAFEPPDLGPFYGAAAAGGTLGGAIACNLAGPRRLKAGAARDHFLGAAAVNGRGERFKTGGRVVKNVTGYDLCKLLAGSYGTLAALTEITVKVLPAPETTMSILLLGLEDAPGVAALTAALGSVHEISGAAHLPKVVAAHSRVAAVRGAGGPVTALRIEGFPASVLQRALGIKTLLAPLGPLVELQDAESAQLWRELRDLDPLAQRPELEVWRLSLPPSEGPVIAARLRERLDALYWYDWGGGLLWLGLPPSTDAYAGAVRAALKGADGHATLMRAPDPVRAAVAVFEPPSDGLGRLAARVKAAFDPQGILNPGRMIAGG